MQETIVIRYHYGPFISLLIETENKVGRCPHSAISSLHQTLHHCVQKDSAVHLLFAPINEWNIPLFRIPAEKFLIPMLSWMQTWSFRSRQSLLFTYSNNCVHSSCPHPSPFRGDAMRASPAQTKGAAQPQGRKPEIWIWECICILPPTFQREGEKPVSLMYMYSLWEKKGKAPGFLPFRI